MSAPLRWLQYTIRLPQPSASNCGVGLNYDLRVEE